MILSGNYQPLNGIYLANVSSEEITFTWNSVVPVCSSIYYRIIASNCGVCPTISNTTVAICYDVQPSTNLRNCTFGVQNVICGVEGNRSEIISIVIGGMLLCI